MKIPSADSFVHFDFFLKDSKIGKGLEVAKEAVSTLGNNYQDPIEMH